MTVLQMFQLVNECETIEQLENAILKIGALHPQGKIVGRAKWRDAKKMASFVSLVVKHGYHPETLTRNFGIRQQALYLHYYLKET